MSYSKTQTNAKAILTVVLSQGPGLMILFREFEEQLKTVGLSYSSDKILAPLYDYMFGDIGDTESMRPKRPLYKMYDMRYFHRENFGFYPRPSETEKEKGNEIEDGKGPICKRPLFDAWKSFSRLQRDDLACGAFLTRIIYEACDTDLRGIMRGWGFRPEEGRRLLVGLRALSIRGQGTARALDIKAFMDRQARSLQNSIKMH